MKKLLLITSALVALGAGPAHAGPVAAAVAWVGSTLAAGGFAAALLQTAIGMGLSLLGQVLAKARMDKPEISVKFTVQQGDDRPLSFIAGDYVTAGNRKYIGSWGKNTRFITEVVELSALPQPGLVGAYVDDEPAEFTGKIGAIPFSALVVGPWEFPLESIDEFDPGSVPVGWVQVGRVVSNYSDDGNRINIKYVDGTQAEADPFLKMVFENDPDYPWTADMIGTGKSYAIITTRYDDDTLTSYPQYLFQPAPLAMYDVRKDTTAGGSGAHRWGVATTYEPTRNPAVIAYNIIRGIYFGGEWVFGGKNLAAWRLPAAEWMAAANECDALVNIAGGGTEPAYRCGMEITVDMAAADVLEEIGKAANMHFAEVGGAIKPVVGLPGAAVLGFTDEDIIITEGQSFKPFYPVSETFNSLSATYPEPGEKWATKDSPEFIDAAATADDGGRYLPTSVSYPAAPYGKQVQRLQRAQMQDFRRFRRHQFHLPPEAYALEPGVDMVSWSSERNGYINKLFVVESVSKTPGMNVLVSLREVDPSDYDWSSDFELPIDITPPVNPIPFNQPINGLTATPAIVKDNASNDRRPAILVQCDGDETGVTDIQIEGRVQGEPKTITTTRRFVEPYGWYLLDVVPLTIYEVRARLISNLTPKSQWSLWLTVTTPDVRLQWADLAESIEQAVQDAQDTSDQVAQAVQDEVARAEAVEAALQAAVDAVEADVVVVQGEVTDTQNTITTEIASVRDDMATEFDQVYADFQAGDEGIQQQVDLIALQVNNTSYIRKTDGDGGIGQWTALTGATAPTTSASVPPGQTGTSIVVSAGGALEQPYYGGVNMNGTVFRIRGWVNVVGGGTARAAIVGSTLGNGPGGETVLAQSDPITGGWQQIDMQFTVGVDTDEWAPAFLVDTGQMNFWRVRLEDYSAAANLEASIAANGQAIVTETQARVQMGVDITAAYQDADSDLQAGITSNTVAIADEESARVAAIERLEARSTRTLNNKTNFQDGERGNWTSGTVEDVTVQGYTKALQVSGLSNEEPIRDGDVRGWTVRIRGLARTDIGAGSLTAGIQRFNNASNMGHVSATVLGVGQGWTEFTVDVPISEGLSDANRWRIRTGTTGAHPVQIAWIEFIDITGSAEAMAAVQQEALARATEDTALAGRIDTVEATVGDNTAAISQEVIARTDADNALAATITTLESAVDDNTAAISTEAVARADADSALSGRIDTVEAAAGDNTAAISQEAIARANADSAMAADISRLETAVGDNEAAITAETLARSNADSALATQITTLEAKSGRFLNSKQSFEDGTVGNWTTGINAPANAPPWTRALQITENSLEQPIRPGDLRGRTIRIRGRAQTGAGTSNLRVGVQRINSGAFVDNQTAVAVAVGQTYTDFDTTFTIPAGAPDANEWRPQLRPEGGASPLVRVAWVEISDVTDAAEANATAETAITVATDAEQAIATMNTTINAQYGSLSAFVTQTATAIADQDDFSAAYFGITAEIAGGDIVGLKGTTWNDPDGSSHSLLKLIGDNVVVPGTLSTAMLSVHDPANLVPDNNFTSNIAWGTPAGHFDLVSSVSAFNSSGAIRFIPGGGTGFTGWLPSRDFSVFGGKEYHTEVRVYSGGTQNVQVQVVWYDSTGAVISGSMILDAGVVPAGNNRTVTTMTAPAAAQKAIVRLRVDRDSTPNNTQIGDIIIRAKEPGSVLITPNSITAPLLTTGELITTSAQIKDGIIVSAKIGNAAIDTAHIKNLSVDRIKVAGNAITTMEYSYTSAGLVLQQGTNASVQTLTFTKGRPDPVPLDCKFAINGTDVQGFWRVLRGPTQIARGIISQTGSTSLIFDVRVVDTNTSPGSVTYSLVLDITGFNSTNPTATQRYLGALNAFK